TNFPFNECICGPGEKMKEIGNPFHLSLNNATAVRPGVVRSGSLVLGQDDGQPNQITLIGLHPLETPDTFSQSLTMRKPPPLQPAPPVPPWAYDEQAQFALRPLPV